MQCVTAAGNRIGDKTAIEGRQLRTLRGQAVTVRDLSRREQPVAIDDGQSENADAISQKAWPGCP